MVTSQSLEERFTGSTGQKALLLALEQQKLVQGDKSSAQWLRENGILKLFEPGEILISEKLYGNSVFFIVAGDAEIILKGNRHTFVRKFGDHVGEMAAIDPQHPRSATVKAKSHLAAIELTADNFLNFLEAYPKAAIATCTTLASRLRERDSYFRPVNGKPKLFVISASEDKEVAFAVERTIKAKVNMVDVQLWFADGTFELSTYTMPSLVNALNGSDFALAIGSPIDKVVSRGNTYMVPRDNVLLEYGMAVTALGLERSFFMMPDSKIGASTPDKTASDLFGLNLLIDERSTPFKEAQITHALDKLAKRIIDLGPLETLMPLNKG